MRRHIASAAAACVLAVAGSAWARQAPGAADAAAPLTVTLAAPPGEITVGDPVPLKLTVAHPAGAVCTAPEILFFDEPNTGLDPIMTDVINDLIVKTVGEMGATALTITHDMASARKVGHRIAMLHAGKSVWNGPVGEIDRSGNPYVDQFINGRAEGPIRMAVRA